MRQNYDNPIRAAMRLIAAAVLLLLASSNIVHAQGNWTSLNGPYIAKSVNDISFHSDGTVYAADGTRLLKSTNSGSVWRGTGTDILSPLVVHCKPDVANGANITVSGTNFLHNSTTGGTNWTTITGSIITNLTPLALVGSPLTPSNVFFGRNWDQTAGAKTVWRSTQGGTSWSECQNFIWQTDAHDATSYPVSAGTRDGWLWVAGSYPASATAPARGLFYSADAGVTWTQTSSEYELRSVAVIHKTSPSPPHLYAATSSGMIVKSTNLGSTWTPLYTIGPTVRRIRINSSNNYIFVASSNGVYRSVDEGANWSQVNSGLGTDTDVKSIALLPTSNTMYIGTLKTIYKSTDNGGLWTDVGVMNAKSVTPDHEGQSGVWAVSPGNGIVGASQAVPEWHLGYAGGSFGATFSSERVYRNPYFDYTYVAGTHNGNASLYRSTDWDGLVYETTTVKINDIIHIPSGGVFKGTIKHPAVSSPLMDLFGGTTISGNWRNLFSSNDSGASWAPDVAVLGGNNVYVNDLLILDVGVTRKYAVTNVGGVYVFNPTWSTTPVLQMGHEGTSVAGVAGIYSPPEQKDAFCCA